jgi:hypothetical protein
MPAGAKQKRRPRLRRDRRVRKEAADRAGTASLLLTSYRHKTAAMNMRHAAPSLADAGGTQEKFPCARQIVPEFSRFCWLVIELHGILAGTSLPAHQNAGDREILVAALFLVLLGLLRLVGLRLVGLLGLL